MKRILLISLSSFIIANAQATVFNISVANFQFSPTNIQNVLVGDVIQFNWLGGSHTTTCDPNAAPETSLPAGAVTWNVVMNSGHTTYQYTVTKPGTYNYVCIPHSPNMAGSFTVSASLPVILTSFNVSKSNSKAFLNWQTSSEQNSKSFSLKKSTNGANYQEIASIPAAGYSNSLKSYSFVDNEPSAGNAKYVYYFLEMIDRDGKSNFSPTVLFSNTNVNDKIILSAIPNPVKAGGHLMIDFNADIEGEMSVGISTIDGKSVLQSTFAAHKGVNMGHLHVGKLPAGTYKITYVIGEKSESQLLMIQ